MKHLAIIADGNRRWAVKNGLPKEAGYPQGLIVIERCCLWCIQNGVDFLSVFCFSSENWGRAQTEIDGIFTLARQYFDSRREWYVENGIRVQFRGRRDRLPKDILESMDRLETATEKSDSLTLIICCDYGGRDEIIRTVNGGAATENDISKAMNKLTPDPEVIVRTGGRHRLSNFMLWQAAYSEIFFTDKLFPDLDEMDLNDIESWFEQQVRTFGR